METVVICIVAYLVVSIVSGLLLGRWFYANKQYRVLPPKDSNGS